MSKKHFINPDTIIFVSSVIITLTITAICFSITNSTIKDLLGTTRNSYKHIVNSTLNSNSKLIQNTLENYKNSLDLLFDEDFFTTASNDEIKKYFSDCKKKINKNFTDIFYMDDNSNVYCSSGTLTNFPAYKESLLSLHNNREKYSVSNGFQSQEKKSDQVFVISRAVHNQDGKLCGSFGAIINLNLFKNLILQSDSVIENSYAIILDSDGYFLYHTDPNMILRNFTPVDSEFTPISSKYISSINSGEVDTINTEGEPVHLVFKKIEDTKWTLASVIPQNHVITTQRKQVQYKTYLLFITIFVLVLLIAVENILVRTFQSKELMVTTYDPLTNVWTRQKFEAEAAKMLKKHPYTKFMLVETDIKGFKFINQNYSEIEADNTISFLAKLLQIESNRYHSIMGRGFADHFYTFVRIDSVRNAMNEFKAFNSRLNDSIKQYDIPFQLKFGIAFLLSSRKNKDISIQTLIGQASFAKSTIKDDMVNQYAIYNSRLLKKINEERYLENHSEKALENHEFYVVYQPKISLKDDKIAGAEALVRWKNPELGLLAPDSFIPLFEKNGFVKKLDFYVYEEVFKFLKKLKDDNLPAVPISINMSRNHSKPDKFMHDFVNIFNKYEITPDLIEVEILERSVMDNNTLKETTDLLHKEGFSVAMDDFGSGESSLNMLTTIPVDVLKFDRTFLLSATDEDGNMDPTSSNFIGTLIELSRSLNKKTIFEGVETEAQRDFLKSVKCDQVQGYYYSRPLSEEDFIEFLKLHL